MASILIVDDDDSIRELLRLHLSNAGYEVRVAEDAIAAGYMLLKQAPPDLIISDVNMPRMDGISFLKAVKANPSYKFTPVIMLTTEAGEDKKNEGRAAGAKAWIVKPFQPQTMLDAVALRRDHQNDEERPHA